MRDLMNKWIVIVSLVTGALLGVASAADEQPNILFIVSEDNGPELGCYGDTNASSNNMTPTLDQLARDGVLFNKAFVPYSVCSPSRACFYTGTHVAQNGHEGLQTHKFSMYEEFPSYYKLLQEAGYRTGLIGKLHINPGSAVSNYIDYRSITGSNFGQSGRNMTTYANKVNDFITGNYSGADTDKPFVLTINYPDAHLPMHHLAPTNDVNDPDTLPKNPVDQDDVSTIPWVGVDPDRLRDQTAGYYNCLRRLDDGIKMLLDHLAAAEDAGTITRNTMIIYLGDHGAQFSRGKTSVYEAGLRVPLIIKWSGHTADRPGSDLAGEFNHDDRLVSSIDIMPTILQAAGVNVPSHCAGYALQPLLNNESGPWRKYIFGHGSGSYPGANYVQLSARNARYKLIYNPFKESVMASSLQNLHNRSAQAYLDGGGHFAAGCRQAEIDDASTPQHVKDAYARYLNPPIYELYDLEADPDEWINLADDSNYAAQKQELIDALAGWQADPIIADPWANLVNIEQFGLMQENAIGTNYKSNGLPWDYQNPSIAWNYPEWRAVEFPTSIYTEPQPIPTTTYATSFENSEGFTFPATGAFAVFPVGITTDSGGGQWVGVNGAGIWNRSDIAPDGDQVLRLGVASGSGVSSATVTLPEEVTEIGLLRFSYANYSTSTNCTVTVKIREVGTTDWTDVWQQSFTGLQVRWQDKPWPVTELPLNVDGRYEIQFHCDGEKGMKVEQLSVTEKFTPLEDPTRTYAQWRIEQFDPADAADDSVSGEDADPDRDGTVNYLEYLLKNDPQQVDFWLEGANVNAQGYAQFLVPGNGNATDSWSLEYSTNMVDWYPWPKKRLMSQDALGRQVWSSSVPPTGSPKVFLRVKDQ